LLDFFYFVITYRCIPVLSAQNVSNLGFVRIRLGASKHSEQLSDPQCSQIIKTDHVKHKFMKIIERSHKLKGSEIVINFQVGLYKGVLLYTLFDPPFRDDEDLKFGGYQFSFDFRH